MTNVEFLTDENGIEHVIIENNDGTFTSMHKSTYDELKANEATAE
jgi:DNA/RNA endonuclease YhcR with UshA esterase domain